MRAAALVIPCVRQTHTETQAPQPGRLRRHHHLLQAAAAQRPPLSVQLNPMGEQNLQGLMNLRVQNRRARNPHGQSHRAPNRAGTSLQTLEATGQSRAALRRGQANLRAPRSHREAAVTIPVTKDQVTRVVVGSRPHHAVEARITTPRAVHPVTAQAVATRRQGLPEVAQAVIVRRAQPAAAVATHRRTHQAVPGVAGLRQGVLVDRAVAPAGVREETNSSATKL
jgi:hypothetical protein